METLPQELSNAIDRKLAPLGTDELRQWCFDLTQRYRQGQFIKTREHRFGYIAARLPATYGAQRQVLRRIEDYLDGVTTLLDLGSGPGAFAWAAADSMPDLTTVTLMEQDVELLRMGQELTEDRLDPLQISWCRDNVMTSKILPTHDMVSMSYMLNELSPQEQTTLLTKAFNAADQFVLIIEPGTPTGFGNILRARETLIGLGGHVLAPCTHSRPCPLAPEYEKGNDWCHFSVRIPRGKYHRRAKSGTLPYEDEKYCYLVVSLEDLEKPYSRIIREPIRKSGHVIVDVCNETGLERDTISKSDGDAYKVARDAEWGDAWE